MANDTTFMHDYFMRLGLEPDMADVYMALYTHGPQNLLQLSRNARMERTRLYRLLDKLVDANLIEVETQYKRSTYKAAPFSNVQIELSRREQELQQLQRDMLKIHDTLQHDVMQSPSTRVQFYKGAEGIKQMMWNQTRGTGDNLSMLHENMQSLTNLAFFARWVEKCNDSAISFRSLVGDAFLQGQEDWYAKHDNQQLKHWQGRYLAETVYPIEYTTIVYDDVVAHYSWTDGEIFGIEVYNKQMARAQRTLFEMLWAQSTELKK